MPHATKAAIADYQREYRLRNKAYFAAYRATKGTYFLDKKKEWAAQNPGKSSLYVKRHNLWKTAVRDLLAIDIS